MQTSHALRQLYRGGSGRLSKEIRPRRRCYGASESDPSRKRTLHRSGRDIVEVPEGLRLTGKGIRVEATSVPFREREMWYLSLIAVMSEALGES